VLRVLNEKKTDIRDFPVSAESLASLTAMKAEDKISSSAMQQIFNALIEEPDQPPLEMAKKLNLLQVSDQSFLEPIIREVLLANPDEVQRYKEGKKALIGFFIGEVMKRSRGKANPKQVKETITKELES